MRTMSTTTTRADYETITNLPVYSNAIQEDWNAFSTPLESLLEPGTTVCVSSANPDRMGFGKTRRVCDALSRMNGRFKATWFVCAADPFLIENELIALADALKLDGHRSHRQSTVRQSLHQWMSNETDWAVVVDGLPADGELPTWIPDDHQGVFILTGNGSTARNGVVNVDVSSSLDERWNDVVAANLPEQRRKVAVETGNRAGLSPLLAQLIFRCVGYEKCNPVILDHRLEDARLLDESLNQSVHVQHAVGLCSYLVDMTKEQNEHCRELFNLLAFLNGCRITSDFITAASYAIDEPWAEPYKNDSNVEAMLGAMADRGLVDPLEDGYTLHEGIQSAARMLLTQDEQERWATRATRLVNEAFHASHEYDRTWPGIDELFRHTMSVLRFNESLELANEDGGNLLNKVALYLRSCGEQIGAQAHLERALDLARNCFGPQHRVVAVRTNNLGTFFWEQGRLDEARECFEEALAITAELDHNDEPDLTCLNNLCGLLEQLGDLDGAREQYERALEIYEAGLGPNHPSVATISSSLGRVLHALGETSMARANLERALAIDEEAFGPDHHKVALRLMYLGRTYADERNYEKARECYKRALKIHREYFNPEHPAVANDCKNLAITCYRQKDYASAKRFFKEALRIQEKRRGANDPETIDTAFALGKTLRNLEDIPGAIACFDRILKIHEKEHGEDHESVLYHLSNLAATANRGLLFDEAERYGARALAISERIHGPKHGETARVHSLLGRIHHEKGDLDRARLAYERARTIDTAVNGRQHETVARDLNNLGLVSRDKGDNLSALASFKLALEIFQSTLGPGHPRTIQVKNNIDDLTA